MNKIFRKASCGVIFPLLILSGCISTDEKASEEAAKVPTTPEVKEEKPTESKKPVAKEPEQVKEPVVEVIPSKAKNTELTVEPIPEIKETGEVKQPEVESKTGEAAKEKKPAKPVTPETKPGEQGVVEQDEQKMAAPKVPVPTDPNHFVITAGKKDPGHPFYGKGHKMGFLVNNEPGKEIVMERGKTYRIDVATDPKHDVYISLKGVGWGSTPYKEGVEGMYTYKGTITVKPTDKTPDLLYYSCRNHPYMGGKIHVINPGETVKLASRPKKNVTAKTVAKQQYSAADVNQKLMFADMLLKSKNSETVLKSNITEAIELHNKAKKELQAARAKLKAGDNSEAYKKADNAVALLKKSTKLVPNESELERMKDHYKELSAAIENFEASHKENYERIAKKQGVDAAVNYDKKEAEKLKSSAAQLAKKGDYRSANRNLEKAQHMITEAIHKMLDKQTIVYDLNFETAEEEYQYELKRFSGYEELIPIAVEQKKPAEGAKKLMESFVKKGQDLRDRAVAEAKKGDFPTAIAMLQDATKNVRRGLRMIGVMQ